MLGTFFLGQNGVVSKGNALNVKGNYAIIALCNWHV